MQRTLQELKDAYRNLSDNEIASLHADAASLTDDGRVALAAEVQRRGMSDAHLLKLHSAELRREAHFDRGQQIHRKRVVNYLTRDSLRDPKWTIAAVVVFLALVLFFEYVRHRR